MAGGIAGLSPKDMRAYLEYVADLRLARLGWPRHYGTLNPFAFMELQDVQELANFFERRVSAYQVSVEGELAFDAAFREGRRPASRQHAIAARSPPASCLRAAIGDDGQAGSPYVCHLAEMTSGRWRTGPPGAG